MAGGKAGRKQPPPVATATSGEEEEMEAPTPTGQQAQIQLLQQQLLQAQAQITALQQQQQQNNVRFAVNPAAYNTGILDFDKKKDYAHQQKASESVFADTSERYNLHQEKTQNFLNRIQDRCKDKSVSVIEVPSTAEQIGAANPMTKNFCEKHGELPMEHLKAYVQSYIGQATRAAQDDYILKMMIKNSLTEKAYQTIVSDRAAYTVDDMESGLLLLKVVLEEASVNTAQDPELLRTQLASAKQYFAKFKYDVPEFSEWVKTTVGKLHQQGEDTQDLRAHLFAALKASNDPEFNQYIKDQSDYIRDNPEQEYTWKKLLSRARSKYDALKLDKINGTAPEGDDPILALQTELKEQRKVISKLQKKNQDRQKTQKHQAKKAASSNKDGKSKSRHPTFPKSLRNADPPADPKVPQTIDGIDYYYCTKHRKWGKHPTKLCKLDDEGSKGKGNDKAGERNGRAVKALAALPDE